MLCLFSAYVDQSGSQDDPLLTDRCRPRVPASSRSVISADFLVGKGGLVAMNSSPTDADSIFGNCISMELLYTASVYTACS